MKFFCSKIKKYLKHFHLTVSEKSSIIRVKVKHIHEKEKCMRKNKKILTLSLIIVSALVVSLILFFSIKGIYDSKNTVVISYETNGGTLIKEQRVKKMKLLHYLFQNTLVKPLKVGITMVNLHQKQMKKLPLRRI